MTVSTYINKQGEKILVDSTGFKIRESKAIENFNKMKEDQAAHRKEVLPRRIERARKDVEYWTASTDSRAAEFLKLSQDELAELLAKV